MNYSKGKVVFDFCDTIYNGQSLDDFVSHTAKKRVIIGRIIITLKRVLFHTRLSSLVYYLTKKDINKFLDMLVFLGFIKSELQTIGESFAEENKEKLRVKAISLLRCEGNDVIISSGGLHYYIVPFLKGFRSDIIVLSAEFYFFGSWCTGVLKRSNLREEKVTELERLGVKEVLKVFTDDISDLPLLNMAHHKIIVAKSDATTIPDWVTDERFSYIDLR